MNETAINPSSQIIESSDKNFVKDVIEASREALILVDFWAPWCAPCRQLTPVLEKVIGEAGAGVRLVKINIDENPGIAGQLGIQSIPAVIAFKDAKPADGFMGAQPESKIRQFIEKNGGNDNNQTRAGLEAAAKALENENYEEAAGFFTQVLEENASDIAAIAGLARSYLGLGDYERALQALELTPKDKQNDPEIASVRAIIELAGQSQDLNDIEALKAAVIASPDAHEPKLELAMALNVAGEREEASAQLLESIRLDRSWNEETARKQLLQFFDAWGAADPATVSGRRGLSAILFS